jgi:two-component system sensor histidine kinase KdpD
MHIDRTEDVVMLFMFFIVALTNGVLTSQLRNQKNKMSDKERRSDGFYNLLKELSSGKDLDNTIQKAIQQIQKTFKAESVIFFSSDHNKLNKEPHSASNFIPDEMEWFVAELAYVNKKETGKNTDTLSDANATYFPLHGNDKIFGVIGIRFKNEIEITPRESEFLAGYVKEITPFLGKH